ncbi:hypothetical protein RhiirC2_706561 [Rhizophagus irregularis]|uniref:Uncharacterized protein n=1 Tax=Rhizophagus irregularis TaxID=588596 RepID=A0A2N1NUD2_9GLOM|nr:hypothetical protein RhiirC2_706561 [Rhizophagus irregularis]
MAQRGVWYKIPNVKIPKIPNRAALCLMLANISGFRTIRDFDIRDFMILTFFLDVAFWQVVLSVSLDVKFRRFSKVSLEMGFQHGILTSFRPSDTWDSTAFWSPGCDISRVWAHGKGNQDYIFFEFNSFSKILMK